MIHLSKVMTRRWAQHVMKTIRMIGRLVNVQTITITGNAEKTLKEFAEIHVQSNVLSSGLAFTANCITAFIEEGGIPTAMVVENFVKAIH